jgi:drug/metabolite transporter (DMT)-like permease
MPAFAKQGGRLVAIPPVLNRILLCVRPLAFGALSPLTNHLSSPNPSLLGILRPGTITALEGLNIRSWRSLKRFEPEGVKFTMRTRAISQATGISNRTIALAASLATTAIWSSSFVVAQIGLRYMGPLTVVALQYVVALVVLLPFLLRGVKGRLHQSWRDLLPSRKIWIQLVGLGMIAYVIGNVTLIFGLQRIPAATAALLLNTTPLLVMLGSAVLLKERPTLEQTAGIAVTVLGSAVFFSEGATAGRSWGVLLVMIGVLAFSCFSLIGRDLAKGGKTTTELLTAVPLATAALLLTIAALAIEGMPIIRVESIAVVVWLGILDTAIAYALYNHALRELTATEISAIISLTPLGTALIGWLCLGQQLVFVQIIGLVCTVIGILIVECRPLAFARRLPAEVIGNRFVRNGQRLGEG